MAIRFNRPDLPEAPITNYPCFDGLHDDCEGMWPWPGEQARERCGCPCHEIEAKEQELAA